MPIEPTHGAQLDFLIIGAAKSGTTTLYHDLVNHPAITFPAGKEPDWFSTDDCLTDAGRRLLAEKFPAQKQGRFAGAAPTRCTVRPQFGPVHERVHQLFGELPLVYVVRNPIERALSHHRYDVGMGYVGPDVNQLIHEVPTYIDASRYAWQLELWLERFGRERLKVIRFEDYVKQRQETTRAVLEFIGLDPAAARPVDAEQTFNESRSLRAQRGPFAAIASSSVYRELIRSVIPVSWRAHFRQRLLPRSMFTVDQPTPQTLELLHERLAPDAARLPTLLGADAPTWDLDATLEQYAASRHVGEPPGA